MADKIMFLGLFILFGGAVSLAFGFAAQRRESAMRKWPTVPGTVVSSEIVRTVDARLRPPVYSRPAPTKPTYRVQDVWALDVSYRYVVNGTEQGGYRATSSRLVEKIGNGDAGPGEALRALQARLPAGAAVPVHYDPANPAESYLFYRDGMGGKSRFRTGFALVLIGAVIAIAGKAAVR